MSDDSEAATKAFFLALTMGNAVALQHCIQNVQMVALGKISKYMTEVDAAEALAVLKMLNSTGAPELDTVIAAAETELNKTGETNV